jgi:purine-binding chemotaxis protein CheW
MSETSTKNAVRQFLTFLVGTECFAVDVLRIRGVVEAMPITRVPSMPSGLRGVVNLRGAVVPVVDLGVRLGRSELAITKWTCIIITQIERQGDVASVGLLVDAVRQVIDLREGEINPVPALATRAEVELVEGMGTVDASFVLILDVDRVLELELPRGVLEAS